MNTLRPVDLSRPFAGVDRLARHLTHHAERQQLLAANLSNLDTPGYRARDVGITESLTVTTRGGAVDRSLSWEQEVVVADDEAPDQDGNTVSLEGQMAKMSSNLLRYRSLAELLSRRVGMLRYAATDGG